MTLHFALSNGWRRNEWTNELGPEFSPTCTLSEHSPPVLRLLICWPGVSLISMVLDNQDLFQLCADSAGHPVGSQWLFLSGSLPSIPLGLAEDIGPGGRGSLGGGNKCLGIWNETGGLGTVLLRETQSWNLNFCSYKVINGFSCLNGLLLGDVSRSILGV